MKHAWKPFRSVPVVIVVGGLLAISSIASAGTEPVDTSDTEVKVPTTEPGTPDDSIATDNYPEYEVLAKTEGISVEQAEKLFQFQGEVTLVIEGLMDRPEYVDFRFTEDGMLGQLVVEPAAKVSDPFAGVALPDAVGVSLAKLDQGERDTVTKALSAEAEVLMGEQFVAVTYDAFENTFVVYADDEFSDVANAEAALATTTSTKRGVAAPTVSVRIAEPTEPARGGQTVTRPGGSCTTGFGLIDSTFSAYLTAGHCNNFGSGAWTINGNTSSSVAGISVNSYNDRMSIRAGGASWLVRITPTSEVDMSSSPGHIFANTRYCHFGQASDILRCANVVEVNFPVNQPTYSILTSRTTANCIPGDSGGPVWLPWSPERRPTGLQSHLVTASSDCLYVSLDDQLAGTGWTLL